MNIKWQFVLLILMLFLYVRRNFIPISGITGKYINNNTAPILEGPSSIENGVDTLILLGNNEFKSRTWGDGTYQVEYSLRGTVINLSYYFGASTAGFSSHIYKSLFGKKRICLNEDMEFFFEKID